MAKKVKEEVVKKYPSIFGSHACMVNEEKTFELNDPNLVVIEDEFGFYTTGRKRLDDGLADPNRYATARLTKLFNSKKEDKKD